MRPNDYAIPLETDQASLARLTLTGQVDGEHVVLRHGQINLWMHRTTLVPFLFPPEQARFDFDQQERTGAPYEDE